MRKCDSYYKSFLSYQKCFEVSWINRAPELEPISRKSRNLDNFICEEWSKKQRSTKPKSSIKLHPLVNGEEFPNKVPVESDAITDLKQTPHLYPCLWQQHFSRKFGETAMSLTTQSKVRPTFKIKKQKGIGRCVLFAEKGILLRIVPCLSPSNSKKDENLLGNINAVSIA